MPKPTAVALVLCLTLGWQARAAQPELDPIIQDESVEETSRRLRESGEKPSGIRPTRAPAVVPVRPHADIALPEQKGRLLPEGAFVVQLEGRIHAAPSGAWVFEPAQRIDNADVRPMIVLPSQSLARLVQLVGQDASSNLVSLTGEILLYRGRNYILVSAITAQPHAQTPAETPQAPDAPAATPIPSLSPGVQDLIRELEESRHADRTILQPVTAQAGSGRAPVPEGRTFMRRRARMVYLPAGEIALAFDNDPDQVIDVPLVVLPCHLLERMEQIVETRGDSLTVRVSGQSYAYNGRSYVLPTSIVIQPPGELHTRQ